MAILLLITVNLTGCFSSHPADIEAFLKPHQVDVTVESYVLQPPDEIEIHCLKVPEIHLQQQQIRPDGKVSFEGLGEIEAAGKTPKELTELLREKALRLYALTGENPIDVRIVVYKSKMYYVLGQVYFRGSQESTGRDTVLTALAKARPTSLAWIERVQVIRPSADKGVKPKIFELNYDKMIAHGDTSKNVLLQDGDIIYVPPTVLAAIGMKVEELISPIGRAFSTVNIIQGPPARRD
jgi:polysaccharide export outer membrane protein